MPKNLDKVAFVMSAVLLALGIAFVAGLYSGVRKNFAYEAVRAVRDSVVLVFEERENLVPDGVPVHSLQPARGPGSGVTVNARPDDGRLILIAGFFDDGNELRLLRRDGTPVARWPVRFSKHFPDVSHLRDPPHTDRNIDLHGALVHPDGSVVFNYDYGGTVKLSRCGETLWTLAHPTHHSIETSERGGYWIPGRRFIPPGGQDTFPPFTLRADVESVAEDLVLKVAGDGRIVERRSVPGILYDNGFEPIMTANGFSFTSRGDWNTEIVHLNKVGELSAAMADAFPGFEAGDLVLSLREQNMVLVVDPGTWKVKWHRIGPWRRQHDPEFNADGTISVFNNNTYRVTLGPGDRTRLDAPRVSNILKVTPSTGRTDVVYGQRAGEEFLSVIRGKHEPLPDGGFLITEFEAGRVFEVDAARDIVWEYIDRYDQEQVLEVTEARSYPGSYFTVSGWECP